MGATKRSLLKRVFTLFLFGAGFLCLIQPALAVDKYWMAPADGVWSDVNNWATVSGGSTHPATVPGSGDIADFDTTSVKNCTVNIAVVSGVNITSGYSGVISYGSSNFTVGSLSYVQAGGTFTCGTGAMTMTAHFTLSGGTFNSTSGTLEVDGNFTQTGGTFNANNGTAYFPNNTSTLTPLAGAATTFYNFTHNQGLTVANNLTITVNGTLTMTEKLSQVTVPAAGTVIAKGAVITIATEAAFGTSPIIVVSGTGTQTVTLTGVNGTAAPGITLNNPNATLNMTGSGTLGFRNTVNVQAGTFNCGSINISNSNSTKNFINSGTLTTSGSITLTLGGTFTNNGTIISSASGTAITATAFTSSATSNLTYLGNGSAAVTMAAGTYGNLTVNNSAAAFSLADNTATTIGGNLTITAGTFNLGSSHSTTVTGDLTIGTGAALDVTTGNSPLTVAGNWLNSGTFNGRSGTVTLSGADQAITGANTFYNLTKTGSSAARLTFPMGLTTLVQKSLTLQGSPLFIRSSLPGTAANLMLASGGTQLLSYLDVQDSNATGGLTLVAYNSTNSGNNTNWSFQTLDLNAGLVAYYKLDNNANDSAGTNTGTVSGATFVTSPIAPIAASTYAANFNGTTDYISVPNSASLNITGNAITLSCWVKSPSGAPGAWKYLIGKNNNASTIGYALNTGATGRLGASVGIGGVFQQLISTTFTWNTQWHFMASTYDGANMRLYVDGVEDPASPKAVTGNLSNNSTQDLNIGRWNGGTLWWPGQIDDVRIYNRALNLTEIKALAASLGTNGTGILTIKNPTTSSTTITNTAAITASFTTLETGGTPASQYVLSNSPSSFGASSSVPAVPAFTTSYTLPAGDGAKQVFTKITKSDSTNYTISSNTITLDTIPPTAPLNLMLTANADNTGFTASVTAPASSDVAKLYWRYISVDGNASPTYPATSVGGTALGGGVSTGVTANSTNSITVTGMTQFKTYGVRVWAEDLAGNISLLNAQASLYLAPPTPRLVVTAPTSTAAMQAGGSTTLTITAKDVSGNAITTYAGPYTLTWTPTGGSATTLVSSSTTGWSAGVTTTTVTIGGSSAGTGTFNATDGSGSNLTNGTLTFTWYPASFVVTTSSASQVAGKVFALTLKAVDTAGATVTGYAGTAALSISGTPASTDGLAVSSVTVLGGLATVNTGYPSWASAATITAKDTTYVSGVTIQGTSSSLSFNPDKFTVMIMPASAVSTRPYYVNESLRVQVTALSGAATRLVNYRGTITFSNVSGVSFPGSYAFTAADAGMHEFGPGIIVASAAGTYTLTVTDSGATGSSGPVKVILAQVRMGTVAGPVGTLLMPIQIVEAVSGYVVPESGIQLSVTLTEEKGNSSATVPQKQILFVNGMINLMVTDTEAEKVTISGTTSPISLTVISGILTFGASSSTSNYAVRYIQFEQSPGSTPMISPSSTSTYSPYGIPAGYTAPSGSTSSSSSYMPSFMVNRSTLSPAGRYDVSIPTALSAMQNYYGQQSQAFSLSKSSYSAASLAGTASFGQASMGYTPPSGMNSAAIQSAMKGLPPSIASAMESYFGGGATNSGNYSGKGSENAFGSLFGGMSMNANMNMGNPASLENSQMAQGPLASSSAAPWEGFSADFGGARAAGQPGMKGMNVGDTAPWMEGFSPDTNGGELPSSWTQNAHTAEEDKKDSSSTEAAAPLPESVPSTNSSK